MSGREFFNESSEQSKVKAAIVSKYFDAWAGVMIGAQNRYKKENKIAYIDLFAGPGRYKDGTQSTPLLILEKAIQKPEIRDRLVTLFNDKDENNTGSFNRPSMNFRESTVLNINPLSNQMRSEKKSLKCLKK